MSNNFQTVNFQNLRWPAEMLIDYVRVWQRPEGRMGCDPADHPTAKYIHDHIEVYSNPNLTTWGAAGYSMPVSDDCHSLEHTDSFAEEPPEGQVLGYQYSVLASPTFRMQNNDLVECTEAGSTSSSHSPFSAA